MAVDIALFYYYSSPSLSDCCYLEWDSDVAYRNLLMFPPSSDKKIHFEFPVFEDQSYNTICNLKGVKSLIRRPSENEKYIIFRTKDPDTGASNIIGYYKIGRSFYYETNMFNNNGFVWGIEANESHLLKKGALQYRGPSLKQGYKTTWGGSEWKTKLIGILGQISEKENIAQKYQDETIRLISIFKNKSKINEWREFCKNCDEKCTFYRRNTIYKNQHQSDLFSVIHHAYTTNLYSRNELLNLNKIYIR